MRRRFLTFLAWACAASAFAAGIESGCPAPIASFREGALSQEQVSDLANGGRRRLAELRGSIEATASGLDSERVAKRLRMARRLCDCVAANLDKGGTDGFGAAELGLEDLGEFLRSFEDEASFWKSNPLNPAVKPVVIDIRSFGAKGDGVADDSAAFAQVVASVKGLGGAPCIVKVPAGNYLLSERRTEQIELDVPTTKLEGQLLLSGVRNCAIVGDGAGCTRITFCNYNATGLNLLKCENVTVKGVELAWRELPFVQGTVVSFDREGGWVEIDWDGWTMRPDDPRLRKPERRLVCAQYSCDGKMLRLPYVFATGEGVALSNNRYRVRLHTDMSGYAGARIDPGTKFVVPDRYGYLTAGCVHSDFCTFDGVWIRSARSSAFSSTHTRSEAVVNCRIFPEERCVMSSNADGFYNSCGSYLAHCDFRSMNDDGCNSHCNGAPAVEKPDAFTLVHMPVGNMRPGTLVQVIRSPSGQVVSQNRLVRSAETVRNGRCMRKSTFKYPFPDDVAAGEFDYLFAPCGDGTCFVAFDCSFSDIRNVGIVVQCPNSLVEACRVERVHKGLHLTELLYGGWREGTAPYNVVVDGLSVRDTNIGISAGALMHDGRPAKCAPIANALWCDVKVDGAARVTAEFRNVSDSRIERVNFPREKMTFLRCRDIEEKQ